TCHWCVTSAVQDFQQVAARLEYRAQRTRRSRFRLLLVVVLWLVGLVVRLEAAYLQVQKSLREALVEDPRRPGLALVQDVEDVAVHPPALVVAQLPVRLGCRAADLARPHVGEVERGRTGRPARSSVPDVLVDSAGVVGGPGVTRVETNRAVLVRARRR